MAVLLQKTRFLSNQLLPNPINDRSRRHFLEPQRALHVQMHFYYLPLENDLGNFKE